MRILRGFGFTLLLLAVAYVVTCFASPATFSLVRSKEFKGRTAAQVQPLVADFNSMGRWSPFAEQEPDMKVTITGTPGAVGQKYAWVAKQNGVGYLQHAVVTPNVVSDSFFLGGFATEAISRMDFTEAPTGTTVAWSSTGKLNFWMRPMGLLMDGMMGKTYERGLAKLDSISALPQPSPTSSL